MTNAIIKHRVSAEGHPFSEVFVDHQGHRFYSRHWYVIDDTPMNRNAMAQQFVQRLKTFPSQIAA